MWGVVTPGGLCKLSVTFLGPLLSTLCRGLLSCWGSFGSSGIRNTRLRLSQPGSGFFLELPVVLMLPLLGALFNTEMCSRCVLNRVKVAVAAEFGWETTLSFRSLLRGNKPALIGCLSQECNLTKVEQHLIAICMLLLSSIGRKN